MCDHNPLNYVGNIFTIGVGSKYLCVERSPTLVHGQILSHTVAHPRGQAYPPWLTPRRPRLARCTPGLASNICIILYKVRGESRLRRGGEWTPPWRGEI